MALRLTFRSVPVLAAAAFVLSCGSSPAARVHCDRFAAPTGSDRQTGTADQPVRTAQRLADVVDPGEVGCLRDGTYDQEVSGPYVVRFNHGGAPGRPITLRSAPGEVATLRGIIYTPKTSPDVRLSHLRIDARRADARTTPVGIQIMAARVTIEDSDITDDGTRSCMILGDDGAYGRARATVIRGNTFHDCGDPSNGVFDHAIYVQAADRVRIVDNVFVRSAGWAVHLYPNAQRTLVRGNVMWDNGGGVVFAGEGGRASSRNLVERNVIGASRRRPELTSSFGEAVGHGNVARDNCLVPGLSAWDAGRGYARRDNRVVDGGAGACGRVAVGAQALVSASASSARTPSALRRLLSE